MSDPRTELVGRSYDVIGDQFVEWRDRIIGDPRGWWVEQLVSRLPGDARVLELGCGNGIPDTKELAQRFRVTGADISPSRFGRRAQTCWKPSSSSGTSPRSSSSLRHTTQ
jgi:SAM-dependent methyltransferase